jgi:hypothetical protein
MAKENSMTTLELVEARLVERLVAVMADVAVVALITNTIYWALVWLVSIDNYESDGDVWKTLWVMTYLTYLRLKAPRCALRSENVCWVWR